MTLLSGKGLHLLEAVEQLPLIAVPGTLSLDPDPLVGYSGTWVLGYSGMWVHLGTDHGVLDI
jgi:hypothetical protein